MRTAFCEKWACVVKDAEYLIWFVKCKTKSNKSLDFGWLVWSSPEMKHWPTSENNKSLCDSLEGMGKKSHDSSKKQVMEFIFCYSTSRVVERSFRGFPALSAVALVKWQTLLPRASHHLQVARWVFRLPQVPYAVHFAASGVRYVKNLSDWVHGQVVLMSRACACEKKYIKLWFQMLQ